MPGRRKSMGKGVEVGNCLVGVGTAYIMRQEGKEMSLNI